MVSFFSKRLGSLSTNSTIRAQSNLVPFLVFDYLACRAGCVDASRILHPTKGDFCWSEIKTGLGIFSDNQYKTLLEICLSIAIFHIEDVMAEPQHIDMDWDFTSGKEFARISEDNSEDKYDQSYSKDNYYRSSGKHSTCHSNYSSNYGNNHGSQRSRIVAKLGRTCRICKRKIAADKDKVMQDNYGNRIHVWCTSQKF